MSDWLSPNPPDIADTLLASKNMKETIDEYIKRLPSYELKTYAKELGCPHPTKLSNPQLVEFILSKKEAFTDLKNKREQPKKKSIGVILTYIGLMLGFLGIVLTIIAWLFPQPVAEDIVISKEVRIPINLIHDYKNGMLYSLTDRFYIKPKFNTNNSIGKFGIYGVDYVRLNPVFEEMNFNTHLESPINCPMANSILEYSFLRWITLWPQAYNVIDYVEQKGTSDTRRDGIIMNPIKFNLDSIPILNPENLLLNMDSLKLFLPKTTKVSYNKNVFKIETINSSISIIFERLGSNSMNKDSEFGKKIFNITRLNPNLDYLERRYVIRILLKNLVNKKTEGLEYEIKWFDKFTALAKKEFSFENIKKEYNNVQNTSQ